MQGNTATLTDENGKPVDDKECKAKIGLDANPRSVASVVVRRRWEGHERSGLVRCPTRGMAGDDSSLARTRYNPRGRLPPGELGTMGARKGSATGSLLLANLREDEQPK